MACDLFEGDLARDVQVFGQKVDIWISPRAEEVSRRGDLGVGEIVGNDCLRALMGLPEDYPVDARALDPAAVFSMDDLLAISAVEIVGGMVYRRAVPPVEIVGFTKVASRWSDVQEATLLRTHGPRYVLAPSGIARRALREIDPEVGVATRDGSGWRVMRPPGVKAVRPSWQRWAVAEAAFGVWLRSLSPSI